MIDKEFKEILLELCPDEQTVKLAIEVLNLKSKQKDSEAAKEIRKVIARYAANL